MAGPPRRYWAELTTRDFAAPEVADWIAVLPIAATEQHGPHLPTGVDAMIGEGLLAEALKRMPESLPAIALPMLSVGKSDEHVAFSGTLTVSATTLLTTIVEIGESVARAGLRKLLIVNSHGGNSEVMALGARELRLRREMLVVATSWARLGYPDGLFSGEERRHGIHAGQIETALMLHLRPDLVKMDAARTFDSASALVEEEFDLLRGTGPNSFAWAMQDLNRNGACGDAAAATAEQGRAAAAHSVDRFLALLDDMNRFDPTRLGMPQGEP